MCWRWDCGTGLGAGAPGDVVVVGAGAAAATGAACCGVVSDMWLMWFGYWWVVVVCWKGGCIVGCWCGFGYWAR